MNQISNRFQGMKDVFNNFSFLIPRKLLWSTDQEITEKSELFHQKYEDDL